MEEPNVGFLSTFDLDYTLGSERHDPLVPVSPVVFLSSTSLRYPDSEGMGRGRGVEGIKVSEPEGKLQSFVGREVQSGVVPLNPN